MAGELFELELYGDNVERRYRKMRPEVEAMPWGTFDTTGLPERAVTLARKQWTGAAFQEHRTAIACAATLRALIECRAPLDLIAMASRFPLDELVHVELCARMAMELGGGTEIQYDPISMIVDAEPRLPPLLRAADMIARFFCVGEALSIPLLRATWHAARHPLPRAVLGRIVKDEAAHGVFGFTFLDWALESLTEADRRHIAVAADRGIMAVRALWRGDRERAAAELRRVAGRRARLDAVRRVPRAGGALAGDAGAQAAARTRHPDHSLICQQAYRPAGDAAALARDHRAVDTEERHPARARRAAAAPARPSTRAGAARPRAR